MIPLVYMFTLYIIFVWIYSSEIILTKQILHTPIFYRRSPDYPWVLSSYLPDMTLPWENLFDAIK